MSVNFSWKTTEVPKIDLYQGSRKGVEVVTTSPEIPVGAMREKVLHMTLGTVYTRWGAALALGPPSGITTVNCGSFKDILTDDPTFPSVHKPCHGMLIDTAWGGLTSTPSTLPEEVAIPTIPVYHSASLNHLKQQTPHCYIKFCKIWEPKIITLKGGYSLSARLIFKSWLKDIHVHVEDWWLTQRKVIHLMKDFITKSAWDEMEFSYGHGGRRIPIFWRPHWAPARHFSIWWDTEWAYQWFYSHTRRQKMHLLLPWRCLQGRSLCGKFVLQAIFCSGVGVLHVSLCPDDDMACFAYPSLVVFCCGLQSCVHLLSMCPWTAIFTLHNYSQSCR